MARRLLRDVDRQGRILDIGCGSHPLFLSRIDFRERYGLDQLVDPDGADLTGVHLVHHDVRDPRLPFDDDFFDAVTMLAVFEHIPPGPLAALMTEIRRVLRPAGRLVLTTPAGWTDPILRTLARFRLVSAEEIDEHQDAYDHDRIRRYLVEAGFDPRAIRLGSFELLMNLWATARA